MDTSDGLQIYDNSDWPHTHADRFSFILRSAHFEIPIPFASNSHACAITHVYGRRTWRNLISTTTLRRDRVWPQRGHMYIWHSSFSYHSLCAAQGHVMLLISRHLGNEQLCSSNSHRKQLSIYMERGCARNCLLPDGAAALIESRSVCKLALTDRRYLGFKYVIARFGKVLSGFVKLASSTRYVSML